MIKSQDDPLHPFRAKRSDRNFSSLERLDESGHFESIFTIAKDLQTDGHAPRNAHTWKYRNSRCGRALFQTVPHGLECVQATSLRRKTRSLHQIITHRGNKCLVRALHLVVASRT